MVVLDAASKLAVSGAMVRGDRVTLLPGLHLVSARNRGIAFGLLAGVPLSALAAGALVLVVGLSVWAWRAATPGRWAPIGLLLGGAVANLADRVADGAVTDLLELPHWPAFNLADVAITSGAALLALGLGRGDADRARATAVDPDPALSRCGLDPPAPDAPHRRVSSARHTVSPPSRRSTDRRDGGG